jgi:glycosyltransferase involved in cell wall biosynthesis
LEADALISVIVPCYNQGAFLPDALSSISDQTYTNWECIIVNDGSSDHTEQVAAEWTNKDSRFRYLKKDNGGLSSARNAGLNIARGAYIQFLDADDTIRSDKFERSVGIGKKTDIVVSNFQMFTTNWLNPSPPFCKLYAEGLTYENILKQWDLGFNIPIHCGLFSKEVLSGFLFNETLKAKEDWLMWIFVFGRSRQVAFVDEPMAFYRLHGNSMTMDTAHMNENIEKVYRHLHETLDEKGKAIIFDKVLSLYMAEANRYPLPKNTNIQDYIEVEKGRTSMGFLGNTLYRLLRKSGHLSIQKEQQKKGRG